MVAVFRLVSDHSALGPSASSDGRPFGCVTQDHYAATSGISELCIGSGGSAIGQRHVAGHAQNYASRTQEMYDQRETLMVILLRG